MDEIEIVEYNEFTEDDGRGEVVE